MAAEAEAEVSKGVWKEDGASTYKFKAFGARQNEVQNSRDGNVSRSILKPSTFLRNRSNDPRLFTFLLIAFNWV